jgi:DNA mismatch repair protein MutS2
VKLGDEVLVRALKRRGAIIEVLPSGLYRVRVGALVTLVRGDDIEAVAPKRRKKSAAPPTVSAWPEEPTREAAHLASVDLHGLSVDEARNRVAGHISRAILAGLDRVEIIHGIGTGKLKNAITADLRQLAAVKAVKPHPSNPGVLIAYF